MVLCISLISVFASDTIVRSKYPEMEVQDDWTETTIATPARSLVWFIATPAQWSADTTRCQKKSADGNALGAQKPACAIILFKKRRCHVEFNQLGLISESIMNLL